MKKTLLIAAAALAASVISSQAQVYSQNIVGYINLTITNNSLYNAFTVQLNVGASNGLNEVFSTFSTNQSGDLVYVWNPATQSFFGNGYLFYWDTSVNPAGVPEWYDQSGQGSIITTYPKIPAGSGVFVQGSGVNPSDTLTIVGAVSIANGSSATNPFVGGSLYTLGGPQLPIASGLYNSGFNPPDGTLVYIWNTPTQSFKGNGYLYYSGISGGQANGGWYDQSGSGSIITGTGLLFTNGGFTFADLPVNVGDAIYIQSPDPSGVGSTNWVQTLNIP